MFDVLAAPNKWLELGRVGENGYRRIVFPIKEWLDEYPDAEVGLLNQRPGDTAAYPVYETEADGEYLYWTVMSSALNERGRGKCELRLTKDDVIVKSAIYQTRIDAALDESGEAPEPWESWVSEVTGAATSAAESMVSAKGYAEEAAQSAETAVEKANAAAASAEAAAESAQAAADFSFYIDENGFMHVAYGGGEDA